MEQRLPPAVFRRFFRWFCHPQLSDFIEGDLMELYNERIRTMGKRKADLRFIIDVLLLFRPSIIRPFEFTGPANPYDMFKNYFTVSIRNILKYKVFSFINVFGLAAAMSVCLLLILMLTDQYRYDRFHENKDRVYRILSTYESARMPYATSALPLAHALQDEYSVVEKATFLTPGVGGDALFNNKIADMRGYFAEPAFFDVFSFRLEQGDPNRALTTPYSVVISREFAQQLFADENPLGKVIEFSDRQLSFPVDYGGNGSPAVAWGSFTVTGVVDESKYKSHLKFDALVSASTLPSLYAEKKMEDVSSNWGHYWRTYTFALIKEGKTVENLSAVLSDLVAHKYKDIITDETKGFSLQPQLLTDIQLNLAANDTDNRLPRIGYYFLLFLAGIIMVLACLNYTGLSIARALTRAKEIGVRKVTGATRMNLVFQFLSESVITSLLALSMAIIFLALLKPAFRGLWVNQFLNFELTASPAVYGLFIAFALFIGIIAGIYPAFRLSVFQPVKALKSYGSTRVGKLSSRKILSVVQFVVSLFFITTAILVFNQFRHYLEFNYGFTSQNVVNVELQGNAYEKLASEMSGVHGVVAISGTDIVPASGTNNNTRFKKAGSKDEFMEAGMLVTDEHFADVLGLKLIAGKPLPPTGASSDRYILVNRAMVNKLGYKHPGEIVGEVFEMQWGNEMTEVIGVVEDFRYRMLLNKDEIGPLIMRNQPASFQYAQIKVASSDLTTTIKQLEEKWKTIDAAHPFQYRFFDEQLAGTHRGIFDLVSILGFISFLAVTIACLGLLGMATYTAERRTKEVGIRKVLGAADHAIALLLSREFLNMLLVSIVIAAPLNYFVNSLWLDTLPNRVDFGPGTIFIASLILGILGLLTIASQTIRASRRNPVDALRMD